MASTATVTGSGPALLLRTAVDIDVTPLFKQGNEIVCDIDPPPGYAKGGHVQLSNSSSYTLAFNLRSPTSGPLANLKFEPDDQSGTCQAYWSDALRCPRKGDLDPNYGTARLVSSTRLELDVDTPNNDYAVHYRLDFDNNGHFDPIIINQ